MSSSPPSLPFPGRFWPKLLLVLAAFGVPAATTAVFFRFVTEHPLLAFVLVLLYEGVVFILGFVGTIWQTLRDLWAGRIAEWFDHWVQGIISRYRKRYYRYLRYRHQDFDLKGLRIQGPYALELNQIFVELSISPTAPHTRF